MPKRSLDTFTEAVVKEPPEDLAALLPELPKEWKWVTFKSVLLDIQPGFACGAKSKTEGLPHLRMNNIDTSGQIDLSLLWHAPIERGKIHKYLLNKGDVLFNNTNSPELVGKTAVFQEDGDYVFSNHLTRLRADRSKLAPAFLAAYLRFLWYRRYFERNCTRWVNQAAFNKKKLLRLTIPLPPLADQARVAERLDELQNKIRALKRMHDETGKMLERVVPAALERAFKRT